MEESQESKNKERAVYDATKLIEIYKAAYYDGFIDGAHKKFIKWKVIQKRCAAAFEKRFFNKAKR